MLVIHVALPDAWQASENWKILDTFQTTKEEWNIVCTYICDFAAYFYALNGKEVSGLSARADEYWKERCMPMRCVNNKYETVFLTSNVGKAVFH